MKKKEKENGSISIYILRRISIINPDLLLDSSFSFLPSLSPLSFFLSLSVFLSTLTFFFCLLSCFFCLLSCIDRMYRVRSRMWESLIIDLVCSSYSFNMHIGFGILFHFLGRNHHIHYRTHSRRPHYLFHSTRFHFDRFLGCSHHSHH